MPLTPRIGRILSALGAMLLIVGLFTVWYNIDRTAAQGSTSSTGWDSFPRLRLIILVGALLTIVSAVVAQLRPVLVARTVLGLILAALIVRRIVDPPDLDYAVSTTVGVYISLVGAIMVALGGLVDSGREVAARYPDLPFWRPPAGALPPAPEDRIAARAASRPDGKR